MELVWSDLLQRQLPYPNPFYISQTNPQIKLSWVGWSNIDYNPRPRSASKSFRIFSIKIKKCFILNLDKDKSIISVNTVGSWIMWDYGGINSSWASIPFYHYLLLLIICYVSSYLNRLLFMSRAAGLCGINRS